MSEKVKLPRCPYCHKKISYPGAMFLKTKGEYNCGSCKCISNIVISRAAYALASMVCIVALLIVVLYSMGGDHGSFLGLACVLAPFLIFYIMIPFFVRLVPCKDKSAVKRLLEKGGAVIPNETAVFPAVPHAEAKPVKLDVDEDFSAKFMKAKSSVQKNTEGAEQLVPGEMQEIEDIQNTKIAFEINKDTPVEEDQPEDDVRIFRREEGKTSDGEDISGYDEAPAEENFDYGEARTEDPVINEEKFSEGDQE